MNKWFLYLHQIGMILSISCGNWSKSYVYDKTEIYDVNHDLAVGVKLYSSVINALSFKISTLIQVANA